MGYSNLWGEAPEHVVLPRAHEYEIVAFRLEREPMDGDEPYVDIVFRRGAERRLLRFWSPQELQIERGGPVRTGGLTIQDISGRGLERLGVRVADFESSHGAVTFLARTVCELPREAG